MLSLRSSLLSAVAALTVYAVTTQPAAALVSTYTTNGEVYKVVEYVSSDAENVRVSTVLRGPGPRDTFAARTIPIKQSRFASWFKPRLGSLIKGNLWWMGFAATIGAAGWAIDELKSQVVQQPRGYYYGYVYKAVNGSDIAFGSTPDEVCYKVGQFPYYKSIRWTSTPDVSANRCLIADDNGVSKGAWPYTKYKCNDLNNLRGLPPDMASCTLVNPEPVPVSDADFQAAVNSQLAADPAHAATAFTDPATGKGYADLFDPVPYIPGLTQTDEVLVGCYRSGQLQMTNPAGACYVPSQVEYDRIKKLAEDLAAGKTPDKQAEILNEQMKQPLTQSEFEQSNQKFSDAVNSVTESVNSQNNSDYSDIDGYFNDLDGIITGLPNTSLPAPAHISVPQYVDCQQLTLSDGNGHELVFPSPAQCAKIEIFKQGFGYFLAISVVFLLGMQLLTRPHG